MIRCTCDNLLKDANLEDPLFYYLTAVPVLGIAAQWIAWRFRWPSILLLLIFGVGLGTIYNIDEILAEPFHANSDHSSSITAEGGPNSSPLERSNVDVPPAPRIAEMILFPLVSLSVAIIMFEGGLSLRLRELESSGRVVLQLVTVGVLVSGCLTFLAAWLILEMHPRVAALLGGILVVTGPTVVIPLLRHIRPSGRIGSIIKWEGIVIDPVGAILAVLLYEQLFVGLIHSRTLFQSVMTLGMTVAVGAVMGWLAAQILIQMVRRFLVPDFLHGVFFLASALAVYAISNLLQEESGLVTVTLMGIVLANQKQISIDHVFHFKENLRVFLISCLFIVLGSRIDLSAILQLGWRGPVFLAAIIVVVRPVSVFLSTLGSKIGTRERTFLAFLAPRGIVAAAVSSVFALKIVTLLDPVSYPDLVADAERIVPVTFLIIFGTVLAYGLGAIPLARLLGLDDSDPQGILFAGADRWTCEVALAIKNAGFTVLLVDNNYRKISAARLRGLDAECISVLSEQFIEENDFGGIGRLAAVTRSDEVNALAAREFAEVFGRSNVFQLVALQRGQRSSLGDNIKARTLFGPELNYDKVHQLFEQSWQLRTTRLSDEFQFCNFIDQHQQKCHVLFVIENGSKLTIVEDPLKLDPKPGQTLISLVPIELNQE